MEAILSQILSQNGVIAFLFVSTFLVGIYKGIPYLLEKYDKTTEQFIATLEKMQEAHNLNIHTVNTTFLAHIEKNDNGHQIIHEKLDEIKVLIGDKRKSPKK